MKKTRLTLLFCLLIMVGFAQPGHNSWGHPTPAQPNANHPVSSSIVLSSRHGETFISYIDGDIVNRTPQSRVVIPNVTLEMHDIYVVLKRPADKICMMPILPQKPMEEIAVEYNMQRHLLEMTCLTATVPVQEFLEICSPEDFREMLARLKKESFDDSRMDYVKLFFKGPTLFTCQQIKAMGETFSFDKGKVEFLKKAYEKCSDPQNFYQCIDILTFSSYKKEILDYIQ